MIKTVVLTICLVFALCSFSSAQVLQTPDGYRGEPTTRNPLTEGLWSTNLKLPEEYDASNGVSYEEYLVAEREVRQELEAKYADYRKNCKINIVNMYTYSLNLESPESKLLMLRRTMLEEMMFTGTIDVTKVGIK